MTMVKGATTSEFNMTRAFIENGEMVLEGYAILTDQIADIGGYYEIITKEALLNADLSDVVLNKQHDDMYIVARTNNGTLQLTIDDKGLHVRAKLSQNARSKEIYEDVKSGNYSKMSFRAYGCEQETKVNEDGTKTVTVTNLGKLYDVSIVAFPAYENTEIYARNKKNKEDITMAKDKKRAEDVEEKVDEIEEPNLLAEVKQVVTTELKTFEENILEEVKKVDEKVEGLAKKVNGEESSNEAENTTDNENSEDITNSKERERGTNMTGLVGIKNQNTKNVDEKEETVREIKRLKVFAALGNIAAEKELKSKKMISRATAHDVENLLDNHTPGSAAELVDEVSVDQIMEVIKDNSPILSQVDISHIPGTVKFYYEKEGSDGAVWLEDAETGKGEKVEVGSVKVTDDRLQKLVFVSDELRNTSISDFEKFLQREVGREMAFALEKAVFVGDGSGKPEGMAVNANIVKNKVSIDPAKGMIGIIAALKPKLKGIYRQNAIMYMNSEDYYTYYELATDANGNLLNLDRVLPSSRVFPTDHLPKGQIIFGYMPEYKLNIAKQVEFEYSDHYHFAKNVRTYRSYLIGGGKVRVTGAIILGELKAPADTPK